MQVKLRNLDSSPLVVNFAGYNVIPQAISVPVGQAASVDADMSIFTFRKLSIIDTPITTGDLSIIATGGTLSLK